MKKLTLSLIFITTFLGVQFNITAQNVGIGTSTPTAKLQVVNNSTDTVTAEFISTKSGPTANTVNIINTNGFSYGLNVEVGSANSAINAIHSGSGNAVFASSKYNNAIEAYSFSLSSTSLYGVNTKGEGIVGINNGGVGYGAVVGRNDSSGYGVRGFNLDNGIGVFGEAGLSGSNSIAGKFENVNSANGSNVLYVVNRAGASGSSIYALQESTFGSSIYGRSNGNSASGVIGEANTGSAAYGVWGKSTSGFAGYFSGNVQINGTLSKSAGTFKIDHPMDPANKYLIHSFVESPDMMNVYNGNIITNNKGIAVVQLPKYFEAENIDFKYQLTIVDENNFAQARVSKKINNNQFTIMTDKPGIEVSWNVTGVRNDAYAKKHRVVAEVDKLGLEKGRYLNPVENGKSIDLSIDSIKQKSETVKETKEIVNDNRQSSKNFKKVIN